MREFKRKVIEISEEEWFNTKDVDTEIFLDKKTEKIRYVKIIPVLGAEKW